MISLKPTEVQKVLNATGNSSGTLLEYCVKAMVLQIIAKHSFVVYFTVIMSILKPHNYLLCAVYLWPFFKAKP